MRLIHITDPHLTSLRWGGAARLRGKRLLGFLSWYRRRRFQYRPERLAALTRAVAAEGPDLILVTGDLVHIGLPEEIAAATHWLDQLASVSTVMLVPGNHDLYRGDSWAAAALHWGPYFGTGAAGQVSGPEALFPVRRLQGDLCLIGLSSACPTPILMATGRLGASQRQRLTAMLDEAGSQGRFRCLLIHHPPLPGLTVRRRALSDAPALAALLQRHGAELVLHGHLHRNARHLGADGLRVYGTAAASSTTTAAPAAYRRFDIASDGSGWQVHMALKVLAGGAEARTVEEEKWHARRAGGD